jgi:DNA-binding NtrC family response regulator
MSPVTDQYRVLIVDDERIVADTLAIIFSRSGYRARAVYSAEEALALLPDWQPHFAVLDVHLPDMNGIDLAIYIQANYPSCRLTLFSGMSSTSELLDAARDRGHDFPILAKPVPPTQILHLASSLLGESGEDAAAL